MAGGWWRGKHRELMLNGYRVLALQDEKVLRMYGGNSCTTM